MSMEPLLDGWGVWEGEPSGNCVVAFWEKIKLPRLNKVNVVRETTKRHKGILHYRQRGL